MVPLSQSRSLLLLVLVGDGSWLVSLLWLILRRQIWEWSPSLTFSGMIHVQKDGLDVSAPFIPSL
jgi:hypothetical protein